MNIEVRNSPKTSRLQEVWLEGVRTYVADPRWVAEFVARLKACLGGGVHPYRALTFVAGSMHEPGEGPEAVAGYKYIPPDGERFEITGRKWNDDFGFLEYTADCPECGSAAQEDCERCGGLGHFEVMGDGCEP